MVYRFCYGAPQSRPPPFAVPSLRTLRTTAPYPRGPNNPGMVRGRRGPGGEYRGLPPEAYYGRGDRAGRMRPAYENVGLYARPSGLGTRPPGPRPPGPRPPGPNTRPTGPGTRPPGPGTTHPGPGTRPSGPVTRPPGPDTRPMGTGTRPLGPGTRPPGPETRPTGTGRPAGLKSVPCKQQQHPPPQKDHAGDDDDLYGGVCNYMASNANAMSLHNRGIGHLNNELMSAKSANLATEPNKVPPSRPTVHAAPPEENEKAKQQQLQQQQQLHQQLHGLVKQQLEAKSPHLKAAKQRKAEMEAPENVLYRQKLEHVQKLRDLEELQRLQIAQLESLAHHHLNMQQKKSKQTPLPPDSPEKAPPPPPLLPPPPPPPLLPPPPLPPMLLPPPSGSPSKEEAKPSAADGRMQHQQDEDFVAQRYQEHQQEQQQQREDQQREADELRLIEAIERKRLREAHVSSQQQSGENEEYEEYQPPRGRLPPPRSQGAQYDEYRTAQYDEYRTAQYDECRTAQPLRGPIPHSPRSQGAQNDEIRTAQPLRGSIPHSPRSQGAQYDEYRTAQPLRGPRPPPPRSQGAERGYDACNTAGKAPLRPVFAAPPGSRLPPPNTRGAYELETMYTDNHPPNHRPDPHVRPPAPRPPPVSNIQERLLQHSMKFYHNDVTAIEPSKPEAYHTKSSTADTSWSSSSVPPPLQNAKPAAKQKEEEEDEEEEEVDWTVCKMCDVKFARSNVYWVHVRGLAHYQKVEEVSRKQNDAVVADAEEEDDDRPDWAHCNYCNEDFTWEDDYTGHLQSQKHIVLKREHARLTNPMPPKPAATMKMLVDGNSSAYVCKVCGINCNGESAFMQHLAGKQHKKKLKRSDDLERATQVMEGKEKPESREGGGGGEGGRRQQPSVTNRPSLPVIPQLKKLLIAPFIQGCKHPLIGIDYMTEFQRQGLNEEPRYTCELCESKMDQRQVIKHLIGIKHRMKYFKYHYLKYYAELYPVRRSSDKTVMAIEFAAQVVEMEGTQQMRVKVELNPFHCGTDGPALGISSSTSSLPDGSKWVELDAPNCRPEQELPGLMKKKALKSNLDRFKTEGASGSSGEEEEVEAEAEEKEGIDDERAHTHHKAAWEDDDPFRRDPYARDPYARDPIARDPYARDPYAEDRYARDPYLHDLYGPDRLYRPPSRDPYSRGYSVHDLPVGPAAMDKHRQLSSPPNPYPARPPRPNEVYGAPPALYRSEAPAATPPPAPPAMSDALSCATAQNPSSGKVDVKLIRSVMADVGLLRTVMVDVECAQQKLQQQQQASPDRSSATTATGVLNKEDILARALRNPNLVNVDRGLLMSVVETLGNVPVSAAGAGAGAELPIGWNDPPAEHSTPYSAAPESLSSIPSHSAAAAAAAAAAASTSPLFVQSFVPSSHARKESSSSSSSKPSSKRAFSPFGRDSHFNKSKSHDAATKSANVAIRFLKAAEKDMPREDLKSTEQAMALLRSLSDCVIENEEDAHITLEICNALTKSMVDYKIQRLSNTKSANRILKVQLEKFNRSASLVARSPAKRRHYDN